jgi:hypothetical protein
MLGLLLALFLAPTSQASVPAGFDPDHGLHEPWDAFTNERTPRTPGGSLGHTQVFGRTLFGFTGFRAGTPLIETRGHRMGLGLQVAGSFTQVIVPSEGRAAVSGQFAGAELDVYFNGKRPGTSHMLRFVVHQPAWGLEGPYLMEPAEIGQWTFGYSAYIESDRVDTSVDLMLGLSAGTLGRARASVNIIVPASETLRFSLGGTGAAGVRAFAHGGALYRPTDYVELGLVLTVPIPLEDVVQDGEFPMWPTLQVKLFQ